MTKLTDLATHVNQSYQDMGKFFRSRPGSADYRAACSCGWVGSTWYYKSETDAAFKRHAKRAQGGLDVRNT